MLIEESMEQVTSKILISLGYHPPRGTNPLSFKDRVPNPDCQEFVDQCIAGAMICWKRGAVRNLHKPA